MPADSACPVESATTGATAVGRLEVGGLTAARVVLSEWTKLHSLRSTRWSFVAAIVLTIGLPLLFAAIVSSHWGQVTPHERANRTPLDVALSGVSVSQLVIAVLGVLTITGEYSTGMIRASFTAVPKRLPVLWAKTFVFAAVTFVIMLPCVVIAFFASQAVLARHQILQTSITHPGVLRPVIGGAVYLMLVGMFALAIGAILRNTAGGISADLADARPSQPRSRSRAAAVHWLHDPHPRQRRSVARPPRHLKRSAREPLDLSGSRRRSQLPQGTLAQTSADRHDTLEHRRRQCGQPSALEVALRLVAVRSDCVHQTAPRGTTKGGE